MSLPGRIVADTVSPITDLAQARDLVAEDMAQVDAFIRQSLRSDVVLIRQVAEYIIGNGGKRLRPLIHLLAARAFGYEGENHIRLAAIVEFIHTATLLHDDVVDESDRRRGRDTANAVWGNAASVLVGDFLYSRSFQMMVEVGSMDIMSLLADATNTIAEGEVLQLMNLGDPDVTEESYLKVIQCKTAKLFEAACAMGAVLANAGDARQSSMARFGRSLGIAFQLADDAMDYEGDADAMGKNLGDDLAEGKPTLPLIRVLECGTSDERALIRAVLEHGGADKMEEVVHAIRRCGALDFVNDRARQYAAEAKAEVMKLPTSRFREALAFVARFSCERQI